MMLPAGSYVTTGPHMIVPATHTRIVVSTAASHDEAERIARALVDQHLAACVNLVPGLTSIYRWRGEVESASEILLLIKTTSDCISRVSSLLRSLHSYEMPEFLVLHPDSGTTEYLDWIFHGTTPSH